ncbi:DUF882 domain-containing protein [Acuticoccus sp. I52.16.1]|uniref:DUF882 domain-containing protein n=1 Tax=Acuticoccus sp. I52.16.1 TaxID=2928472 RepID=UPI001FD5B6F8|nr:DUF882 domain-containing protein [Acuticoccus sp. I52.16.1]UOM35932.1 DUF882 domain-containing protein [Acuticoccus sp. I52.16.1]
MLRCGKSLRRAARIRSLGFAAILGSLLFASGVSEAEASSRTLKLYFTHTRESIEIVYKRNGSYVGSALRDLNRFLRDWRRNEATKMDPELFDLLWELQQEFGGTINVVSAYRSPATNSMLRSRSRGVAKNSQHMAGRAIDFYIKGANLSKLRAAGMKRQVGGVGYYPTSGSPFVHMDTGSVRAWPRMSRSELARVFPNGKTLHLPSDGKPLAGYAEAQRLEKEGKLTSLRDGGGGGGGNVFAALFGGGNDDEEGDDEVVTDRVTTRRSRPQATEVAAARSRETRVESARVAPAQRPAPPPREEPTQTAAADTSDSDSGGGFFRQLPSVSLGGLIGRSRRSDEQEAPAVEPVALPSTPLTAVASDGGQSAPAPTPTPAPPPAAAPAAADAPSEDAADAPIVVAALPPQRPRPRATAAEPAIAQPAVAATTATPAATLAYARDDAGLDADSPQTAVAAIIPRPSDVAAATPAAMPRQAVTLGLPERGPVPSALTVDAVDALMTPVHDVAPELVANVSGVSGRDFATLLAPDRTAAASDGVLLAPGFLGSATTIAEGGAEWLDTDRFTGTRVTVFASPRS